ncbi:odorant receptor 49b-like [Solenopsis invicta]|uniref:odorant receptor 49b-like n=1 Tax=Solenopsis invicta TaxID=13686 RepID=UPI00193E0A91|nr:odorant receptor 49b-like [Solenopsis invicta]
MSSVMDRYFSLNRTLLLIVGLWPYQKSKFARLYLFCCFSIVATFILFQLTTFMTSKCTADHIIKICSLSVGIIGFLIKYNSFYVNCDTIKYLMEQFQRIHNDLKDNNEIAILERYGNLAKRYTILYTVGLCCCLSIIISVQLWPDFIDIISSANESRPRRLKISTEYFIDEEKYYYMLLLHVNVALCIGLTVVVATGTMLLTHLQHTCGMFKIASYRIKNAIEIYVQSISLKNKNFVYVSLIDGIHIHQKAMMFSEYLVSKFEMTFMSLIVVGVLTLSLNTFRFFQILTSKFNIEDLLLSTITICFCLVYMFLCNFIGQEIIDHCDYVFVAAYEVQWYITPLYIQKLILFLLLRGNKSFGLNVGGLFVASLQCFAMLANASLSYFIFMYSIRK